MAVSKVSVCVLIVCIGKNIYFSLIIWYLRAVFGYIFFYLKKESNEFYSVTLEHYVTDFVQDKRSIGMVY